MNNDPLTELRTCRPRPDESWATSVAGQQIMHRALERDTKGASRYWLGQRPSRSVIAMLVGTVLVGGATAQAVGVPIFNSEPSKEWLVANSDKPLFPADDGPLPDSARANLSARVTQLLTPSGEKARQSDGVPPQFAYGIVGFTGSPTKGYTVVVGKGEDPKAAEALVLEGVSPESGEYLTARVADHSTTELERVWRAVNAHEGSTTAAASYSLDVDPKSGRIELSVGKSFPAKDRAELQALGGSALKIREGGTPQRL